jgi:hypothetical protein
VIDIEVSVLLLQAIDSPFPQGGLRMITGDPNKRTMNDTTDSEDSYNTMIGYCAGGAQCVGGSPTLHAFEDLKQYKPDVVRLQTYFPSCWNGVDLDSYVALELD